MNASVDTAGTSQRVRTPILRSFNFTPSPSCLSELNNKNVACRPCGRTQAWSEVIGFLGGDLLTLKLPFPITVKHRSLASESLPEGGGVETFDTPAALEINRARMSHLESLRLRLENKSVLDVGCGVGHLAQFFLDANCRVVCVDGRPENVRALASRYPEA